MHWIWEDETHSESGETYTAVKPSAGDILQFADGRVFVVERVSVRAMPMMPPNHQPVGVLHLVTFLE